VCSTTALRNLSELQDAWTLWRKGYYAKIDIIPDEIVRDDEIVRKSEAIAAYSGGVDSTFTLLRHATGKLGAASYPLKHSVMMVHGFDVPLKAERQFDSLQQRVRPLLDALGIQAKTIRTNLKELGLQSWEDSFIAQLACCLHNYAHGYGYALLGGAKSYDELILPWGSSPVTDHLMSGSSLTIIHDGAGYSRTDKVEEISLSALAMSVIKVCWQGQQTDRNCGICEKCVRTQLNFLAVGVAHASCFETPPDIRRIRDIYLKSDTQLTELISIVLYAKKKGLKEPWLTALEARIKRYRSDRNAHPYILRMRVAWRLARSGQWQEIKNRVERRLAPRRSIDGGIKPAAGIAIEKNDT
jgi:hypothetical protein